MVDCYANDIKAKWRCYARPAALNGKTCGHENEHGIISRDDLLCCKKCGCTKIASDLRMRRERCR